MRYFSLVAVSSTTSLLLLITWRGGDEGIGHGWRGKETWQGTCTNLWSGKSACSNGLWHGWIKPQYFNQTSYQVQAFNSHGSQSVTSCPDSEKASLLEMEDLHVQYELWQICEPICAKEERNGPPNGQPRLFYSWSHADTAILLSAWQCTHPPPSLSHSFCLHTTNLQKQEVTSQDESFMLSLDGFIIKIDAMCTWQEKGHNLFFVYRLELSKQELNFQNASMGSVPYSCNTQRHPVSTKVQWHGVYRILGFKV